MKTKNYILLFAFVAAFGFSAVIANYVKIERGSIVLWSDERTAQKIGEILRADVANGAARIGDEDSAAATLSYIAGSEKLDDANLPGDFQRAWRAHLRAWRKQSDFLLAGAKYYSGRQAEYVWRKNGDEINRTWEKVLRSAAAHGAEIPENALEN